MANKGSKKLRSAKPVKKVMSPTMKLATNHNELALKA